VADLSRSKSACSKHKRTMQWHQPPEFRTEGSQCAEDGHHHSLPLTFIIVITTQSKGQWPYMHIVDFEMLGSRMCPFMHIVDFKILGSRICRQLSLGT